MCLAVPMKIKKKKGNIATVSLGGVERNIDISLVENVRVGDYVIVHAGFAIQKLRKSDAKATLKLLNEISNETLG
ncbi:MAG: HypC/HybG/HupF family hydrogenase formation chaperone [Candidatus Omnitrophica bacterium]|nr:HypC/HybG/HupF family hydrogenase formation chaperone [Candidatus Omnitrophota bacterium]MCM8824843.1 HypC/HybG/HupF family hydrogenase formation chaperone [Candidatus Omnitrophota bacterium]